MPVNNLIPVTGQLSRTSWQLPSDLSFDEWCAAGRVLSQIEHAVSWWIGDWWAYGQHRYGERVAMFKPEDWEGPSFGTCANCGMVAKAFETSRRREVLSFGHHQSVAALKDPKQADELLDQAAELGWSVQNLRTAVKTIRRNNIELALAAEIRRASGSYGVIYADPPWRFEPWSRETGMDRAADNHYPTMTIDKLLNLALPAAKDCVLFLWATAPMLPQALAVTEAWGFEYKTHCIWVKDHPGTGYWFRSLHEPLLVATRGNIPAPPPAWRLPSVFNEPLGRHSEKPDAFAQFIEGWFPNLPRLEMFARAPRPGWAVWGNEIPDAAE